MDANESETYEHLAAVLEPRSERERRLWDLAVAIYQGRDPGIGDTQDIATARAVARAWIAADRTAHYQHRGGVPRDMQPFWP